MSELFARLLPKDAQGRAAGAPDAEGEARFMAMLRGMTGGRELTEEGIAAAMRALTPSQRAQLLAEGEKVFARRV